MSVAAPLAQDPVERLGTDLLAWFLRPRQDSPAGANSQGGSQELAPNPRVGAGDTPVKRRGAYRGPIIRGPQAQCFSHAARTMFGYSAWPKLPL